MARIVVAGAIANKPSSGGEAWVRLSWLLGFRRLGHEVTFLEVADEPIWHRGRRHFAEVIAAFGLERRAALIRGSGPETEGLIWTDVCAAADGADLLVNFGGHLRPPLLDRFRRRAYLDIDPGWTQIWAEQGSEGPHLDGHDVHFTIAENIGQPGCRLPPAGIDWKPTRQPVVLELWPPCPPDAPWRFTTIATWRTPFGRLEHGGRRYGLKLDEFRKALSLPERCAAAFELALDIHPDERRDLAALEQHGWRVVEAPPRTATPEAFRRYVQGSGAEFSVAQGVYVDTNSGWFSDRTTRYLASGKPALVQDTGFTGHLPCGQGLVAFKTLDEAVAGAQAILADPAGHCEAARAIAEDHFDSDALLPAFLREAGVPA